MAKVIYSGISKLQEALEKEQSRIRVLGAEAVAAGAAETVNQLRQAAPERTGGLKQHIKAKSPIYSARYDGYTATVTISGTDARGQPYGTIAFVNEYGRSNQPPRPWWRPTLVKTRPAVFEKMREVLKREP